MVTNEEIIWQYLKNQGLSDAGAAGLMGNLFAESGLNPQNLQNTYEKKLGYTDVTYTAAVDNGKYTNFIRDSAGYGLAQWTYWSRKQGLYNYAKDNNTSIGNLNTQLEFLFSELSSGYKSLLKMLKTTTSVKEASNGVLTQFEKPADQGQTVQNKRIGYSQTYYDKYGGKSVSNSPLATYINITNNKTTLSSKTLNRISIHCFVGQVTAKQGVDYFATTTNQCSANYVIGYDGSIGCSVDEKDRSWCSSSAANDKQAITIEVASEKTTPYTVTDKAYAALLNLIEDICRRNGKTKVIWNSDKTAALNYTPASNEIILTVHRWFANKSCPGDYLYNKHSEIASTITQRLNSNASKKEEEEEVTQEQFNEMMNTWINEQAKKNPGTYSAEARTWAESNGLINGDTSGNKMYKKFITREEFVVVLNRLMTNIKKGIG